MTTSETTKETAQQKRMTKVTIRMGDDLIKRAMAQQMEGETPAELYRRVLDVGLCTLERSETDTETPVANTDKELETLRLSVTTLSEHLTRQGEQLSTALEQNAQLTDALKSEQDTAQAALALQGITQAQKHLEDSEGIKKRGLWSRFKATFQGSDD